MLAYFTLSDIHLGHNRVKTSDVINQLTIWFRENEHDLVNCELLVINGDIYDRLLPSSSEEAGIIHKWLLWVFKWCKSNNILFRIVKGTDSHDMNQISTFDTYVKELDTSNIFKYIETIDVEDVKGYKVLYVPDNMGTGDEVYEKVKQLLVKNRLQNVDLMFVHGQFHFQLPGIVLESSHDEQRYLNIVKHYIHVGHIHMYKVYDRIIGNGSFPRLQHGEEEPKGGLLAYIGGINDRYIFLENKLATTFVTITVEDDNLNDAIQTLESKLKRYNVGDNIAIVLKNETIARHKLELKEYLKDFNYKFINKDKGSDVKTTVLEYDVIEITPNNIYNELLEQVGMLGEDELIIFKNELEKLLK